MQSSPSLSLPTSQWAEAVLIIDFDESHGQVVQHVYPQEAIPSGMLADIKMLSMPDCIEVTPEVTAAEERERGGGGRHRYECTFQARVRNKESNIPFEALNIYIYFRQSRCTSTRRGYEQRSIVIACRHYYSDFCYRLLSRFADVIDALPMYGQMLAEAEAASNQSQGQDKDKEDTAAAVVSRNRDALDSAIEVCFQHFIQWPAPNTCSGSTIHLPFYGDMIEFTPPSIPPYIIHPSLSLSSSSTASARAGRGGGVGWSTRLPPHRPGDMGFGEEGCGVLGEVNLMAVLAPLGLLPHMWTLWELVLSGQDIVVYSPSAAICSAVVLALTSLTAPLVCCADMRCYINNYDDDTNLFAASADAKFKRRYSSSSSTAVSPSSGMWKGGQDVGGVKSPSPSSQYTLLDGIHVARTTPPTQTPTTTQNIIGITNPFLLRTFSKFQNALFVPTDMPFMPPLPAPVVASDGVSSTNSSSGGNSGGISGMARLGFGFLFSSAISPTPTSPTAEKGGSPADATSPTATTGARSDCGYSSQSSPRVPPKIFKRGYGVARAAMMNPTTASLETIYDEWCAGGGAGRSKTGKTTPSRKGGGSSMKQLGHVLLSLRSTPSVSADKSVLHRLSQFSSSRDASSGSGSLLDGGGGVEAWGDEYYESDVVTVGGLLLREHFKTLTLMLLKPFDSFFTPMDYNYRSNTSSRVANKDKTRRTPNSLSQSDTRVAGASSPSLSVRRVGAKSLWLYADGTTILGPPNAAAAIETFLTFYQIGNLPPSLGGMGKSRMSALLTLLADTNTFLLWAEWRRDAMVAQLCWSMVDTSRDMSLDELLAAFAVEQNKEILLTGDVAQLIMRVENTIANVRAINAVSSSPTADDASLCGHMMQHLKELNDLMIKSQQLPQQSSLSPSSEQAVLGTDLPADTIVLYCCPQQHSTTTASSTY